MTEVITYNDRRSLDSKDAVGLLVDSVYRDAVTRQRREELIEALWRSPEGRASADHALQFLGHASEGAGETERLRAHLARTSSNRRTYVATLKENRDAVFYPGHGQDDRRITEEMPFARLHQIVDRTTPIGSAGSCFATEIALRLTGGGFNYLVTEAPPDGIVRFPARWGLIFNTPSLRQLVERAYGVRETPRLLWETRKSDGTVVYKDPFREHIPFASVAEYEADYEPHREAARRAFDQAEVFVLTLGVNEIWRLEADGSVLSRVPWGSGSTLVRPEVLSVDDNVRELQQMLDVWRSNNPNIRIIVTVSPVPLVATFRGDDQHVITATCQSKSVLRVAADRFAEANDGVYYFPSFETVMYCSGDPWRPDFRHVTRPTVSRVMRLFDTMFVRGPGWAASRAVEAPDPSRVIDGTEQVRLLASPDWSDEASLGDIVASYLAEFAPDDDVCLVLWLPSSAGLDVSAAERRVVEAMSAAGGSPVDGAAILIFPHAEAPLEGVTAVVAAGGDDALLSRARAAGVLTVANDPAEWRGVYGAVVELVELERLLDGILGREPGPELVEAIETLRQGGRWYARTGLTARERIDVIEQLDGVTDGRFSTTLAAVTARAWPVRPLDEPVAGVLGRCTPEDVRTMGDRLRTEGFLEFDRPDETAWTAIEALAPAGEADQADLLATEDVRRLVTDPGVVLTAQAALECSPVFAGVRVTRDAGVGAGTANGRSDVRIAFRMPGGFALELTYAGTLFGRGWRPARLEGSLGEGASEVATRFPRLLRAFYE